jgi:tRNA-5-methyluridine54 2-sulfurtransferase
MALCKDHFNEWFLQHTATTIKKFRMINKGDRILAAVSGGKDSLGLWDALTRLGYAVEGLSIQLGIDAESQYSTLSMEFTRKFALTRGLTLHELHIQDEYTETVPEIFLRSHPLDNKPCSTCGLVKRHELNRYAYENGFNVLATGHNLDDEAAVLFSNNLTWNTDQLSRQFPVMEERGKFARRVKPFVQFYERETTAYALLNGIEYIEEECPFSTGSRTNHYKTILNELENDQPGLKYQYFQTFIERKKTGLLKISESQFYEEKFCTRCGQPTSSADLCAFCRLVKSLN